MSKLQSDPRIDPRIKAAFGSYGQQGEPDMACREDLLAVMASPVAQMMLARSRDFARSMVPEDTSLIERVVSEMVTIVSGSDGNDINKYFI